MFNQLRELADNERGIVRGEALRRGISLVIDIQPQLSRIFGERIQLEQAIINVVLNSFDATAGNGERARELRIEARPQAASGNPNRNKSTLRNAPRSLRRGVCSSGLFTGR